MAQTNCWNLSGSKDGVNLIFDTKGDYISHRGFYKPGDYVIGNDRRFRDRSVTWNIFDEVLVDGNLPADYEANAREIASILFGLASRSSAMPPGIFSPAFWSILSDGIMRIRGNGDVFSTITIS